MRHFVGFHLRHDGFRSQIVGRKLRHVAGQVGFNLVFGFDYKAQAQFVTTHFAGAIANEKSAGVPKRVEQRGSAIQLFKSLAGPGQMIGFFSAGCF